MGEEKEFVLTLVPSANDPPVLDSQYQKELESFKKSLLALGLEVHFTMELRESMGGGGGLLGEFLIKIAPIIGSGGLFGLLGAWLQAKYGRKVRVKFGDTEAEARSVEEIRALLKAVDEHRFGKEKRKGT